MGSGWSEPRPGRFTPGEDSVPIVQEAEWAPEPVWMGAEYLTPHRDLIPGPSSPQRVAIPTHPFVVEPEGKEMRIFISFSQC